MCRLLVLASVALLVPGCVTESRQPKVLIFSDQSAGSLLMSSAHRHAEQMQGNAVTFVTDAAQFPTRVDGDNWKSVLVFARWTAQEPAYLNSLRQLAVGKPEAMIYLELWHDEGRTISPEVCVSASSAMTVWTRGITVINYADATDNGVGTQNGIRTFEGQVWPTWENIVPQRPEGIILLPPEANVNRQTFDLHTWLGSRSDCSENHGHIRAG